jgi:acyl carrier protein
MDWCMAALSIRTNPYRHSIRINFRINFSHRDRQEDSPVDQQTNTPPQNVLTAESIQAWFVAQIAEQLEMDTDDIEVSDTFESFGLDSAKAMLIASRAEKMLGFQLSPSLLWHYPTIDKLAVRLEEEVQSFDSNLVAQIDESMLAQALAEVE